MTRERLEAAIWAAMRRWQVTCPDPVRFANAVLAAADEYADAGLTPGARDALTAARRRALAETTIPRRRT